MIILLCLKISGKGKEDFGSGMLGDLRNFGNEFLKQKNLVSGKIFINHCTTRKDSCLARGSAGETMSGRIIYKYLSINI
ncbi:hypothetical protein ASG21_03075 [Chryseobacterium sp. Leaf394]|nr:hypothetical protein ASG21_03075 [Chryseobacterium sp. Leaf394]